MEYKKKKEIKLNEFDIDQLSRYQIAATQANIAANNYIMLIAFKEHGFNPEGNVHRVEYNLKTKSALVEEYDEKEFRKQREAEKGPEVTTG